MKIVAAELRSNPLTILVFLENDYIYFLAYNRYIVVIEMLMDLYMCVKNVVLHVPNLLSYTFLRYVIVAFSGHMYLFSY